MHHIRLAAILAVLTLALSGCATPMTEIPFDRQATADVKTIGIVTPKIPEDPLVVLASNPGQSFGLIGALVNSGMQANRESTFKTLLTERNFSVREKFLQALAAGLAAQGYTVTVIPANRDKDGFLAAYPPGQVDAYLDVVTMGYGYIAAGIKDSTPYRPFYALRAKLVRAGNTSAVLMDDAVFYNPINPPTNAISISPDPNYLFVDFDTLTGNPDRAVAGLQVAVEKTASTVSGLLR